MGSQPSIVGTCSNPTCGALIPVDHPYSWCSHCGVSLPEDLQAQLPKLQDVRLQAQAARERLGQPKPISKERAAAGWGIFGLLFFCAGAWSFFEQPDTGGGSVALGTVALVLAYLTYRGAPSIVTQLLRAVLATLWFVSLLLQALNDLRREEAAWFYWFYAGLVVLGLYYILRIWQKPWTEASSQRGA